MSQHIPDPAAMSGTLETTNTGGGDHERITGVTRIFHHAAEVARNLVDEIRHHGEHAATAPVSQVSEDTTVDLGQQFVPEDSDSEASGVVDLTPGGPDEKAATAPEEVAEAPQEAQEPESPESPAEDAPAAPKTARKRAATKPAPDAPAEAGQ